LHRLERLIQEAVTTVLRALIAETINVMAVLAGRGDERRLAEFVIVEGRAIERQDLMNAEVEGQYAGTQDKLS